jgi:hypothetical protein
LWTKAHWDSLLSTEPEHTKENYLFLYSETNGHYIDYGNHDIPLLLRSYVVLILWRCCKKNSNSTCTEYEKSLKKSKDTGPVIILGWPRALYLWCSSWLRTTGIFHL